MKKYKDLPVAARHYFIAFWVTITISLGLLITGFFLPPSGEVHPSTLEAAGIIFLWHALAFANKVLEEGHTATIHHGNTEFTIRKDEEEAPIMDKEEEIDGGYETDNPTY